MVLDFLSPASLDLFVGRDKIINAFREAMRDYKRGSVQKKGWFITGSPGSGKTSMLNILKRIIRTAGLSPVPLLVPLDPSKMWEIPNNIFELLDDRISQKRQKEYRRTTISYSSNIDRDDSSYPEIINTICEKFEYINSELESKKEHIVFILDNIERMFILGQEELFFFLLDILTTFSERNFKTFFVTTLPTRIWRQIQNDHKDQFEVMELERLDLKEAEILVQRRAVSIDTQVASEITKQTDRSPFSLVYAVTILNKLKPEEDSVIDKILWEQVAPQLRENNFNVLGINEDESKILSLFAGSKENILRKNEVERVMGIETSNFKSLLREMDKNGLILHESGYIQLASEALHQLTQQKLASSNILALIHALCSQIEFELNHELKPSIRLIERMEELSKALDKEPVYIKTYYDLATQTEYIAKQAFSKEFWYETYAMTLLTAKIFSELAFDPERAAITVEDIGKMFFDQARLKRGLLHYSTKLYTLATRKYIEANINWKIKSTAREVAILYEQLGEQYEEEDMPGIARSQYYKAALYFQLAEESNRHKTIIQRGKNVSKTPELALLFE